MSDLRIIKRYDHGRCYYIPQVKLNTWFGFGKDYWCDFSVSSDEQIYYCLLPDWKTVLDNEEQAKYYINEYRRIECES